MGFRRTGRTTRIVDSLVQEFFENGFCELRDHMDYYPNTKQLVDNVGKRVHDRLMFEHHIDTTIDDKTRGKLILRRKLNKAKDE